MSSLLGTRALFAAAAESYHAVGFAACRGCVPPFVLANAEKEVMDVVNSPPVRECVCVCVCVSTAPRITCVCVCVCVCLQLPALHVSRTPLGEDMLVNIKMMVGSAVVLVHWCCLTHSPSSGPTIHEPLIFQRQV